MSHLLSTLTFPNRSFTPSLDTLSASLMLPFEPSAILKAADLRSLHFGTLAFSSTCDPRALWIEANNNQLSRAQGSMEPFQSDGCAIAEHGSLSLQVLTHLLVRFSLRPCSRNSSRRVTSPSLDHQCLVGSHSKPFATSTLPDPEAVPSTEGSGQQSGGKLSTGTHAHPFYPQWTHSGEERPAFLSAPTCFYHLVSTYALAPGRFPRSSQPFGQSTSEYPVARLLSLSSISVILYSWAILPTKVANTSLPSYGYKQYSFTQQYVPFISREWESGRGTLWRDALVASVWTCSHRRLRLLSMPLSCQGGTLLPASWLAWCPPNRFGRTSYVAPIVGQGANLMPSSPIWCARDMLTLYVTLVYLQCAETSKLLWAEPLRGACMQATPRQASYPPPHRHFEGSGFVSECQVFKLDTRSAPVVWLILYHVNHWA
ncbi:uncharacterized protein EI90DRAFT_3257004 [Cantharellus anzutake]|uniref:uncharacterized protein n=1 Tax=Cantharellus anzutake TaxID=1750568 RepID=UPI001908835B|nr:uncharacterized protein EI90DRAFT_3257004 [Cantharellus anzutake]KAF8319192.1 hypothetical protein EI90DRAFT_3257004 [Cantharellus anzutake]